MARKIEIPENEFLKYYNERKSDSEISKIFKCSESKISSFRKSLNLPIVDKRLFTDEDFLKLYNEGYSDKQISEILKVRHQYVTSRRNKLKLEYNKDKVDTVPLTDDEFQVILGTVLGDAHLYIKYKKGNCAGTCNHCLEQEELIFKKYDYLKNISTEPRLVNKHDDRFKVPDYQQWYWYINANPALTELYPMFYKDKIKYVNEELFSKIEPLGLAIWYMDDGSKYQDYNGYLLCTHSFTIEDIKIIQKVLMNKFNISTSINSQNGLYILKNSRETFKNLIEPYIVESMKYKL